MDLLEMSQVVVENLKAGLSQVYSVLFITLLFFLEGENRKIRE